MTYHNKEGRNNLQYWVKSSIGKVAHMARVTTYIDMDGAVHSFE